MKRIILLTLFAFSNLFSDCIVTSGYKVKHFGQTWAEAGFTNITSPGSGQYESEYCSKYKKDQIIDDPDLEDPQYKRIMTMDSWTVGEGPTSFTCGMQYFTLSNCPLDKCDWATSPPWIQDTFRTEIQCHNGNKSSGPNTDGLSYLWNFRWCAVESKCYGLEYTCPTGEIYDSFNQICRPPKDPYDRNCGSCGFYKQSGSVELVGTGTTCFVDYTCKCNPKIKIRTEVSCGFESLHPDPEDPNHPSTPPPQSENIPPKDPNDHSSACGKLYAQEKAKCDLEPGKVLKFSCNRLTGAASFSCNYPEIEPQKENINEGDSTNHSTTEDIKNLSNTLPENIKNVLSQFFTDGSSPYLNSIKGSLEATLDLEADSNVKLSAISGSIDAGLILQSDANKKLDGANDKLEGVNNSLTGIKSSMDGVKNSIDEQKSILDQISDFFNDETVYDGADMPSEDDMKPDSDTTSGFDSFTNTIDTAKMQFAEATSIFSGGVPAVDFGVGTCPTYHFMGTSISISSIGQSISPYSSIFSILIYISLMINIFRMVFGFFSKGV